MCQHVPLGPPGWIGKPWNPFPDNNLGTFFVYVEASVGCGGAGATGRYLLSVPNSPVPVPSPTPLTIVLYTNLQDIPPTGNRLISR